jgi:hypothetical protein
MDIDCPECSNKLSTHWEEVVHKQLLDCKVCNTRQALDEVIDGATALKRFKAPLGMILNFVEWYGDVYQCTKLTGPDKNIRCCDTHPEHLEWCCPSCRARSLKYYWSK